MSLKAVLIYRAEKRSALCYCPSRYRRDLLLCLSLYFRAGLCAARPRAARSTRLSTARPPPLPRALAVPIGSPVSPLAALPGPPLCARCCRCRLLSPPNPPHPLRSVTAARTAPPSPAVSLTDTPGVYFTHTTSRSWSHNVAGLPELKAALSRR